MDTSAAAVATSWEAVYSAEMSKLFCYISQKNVGEFERSVLPGQSDEDLYSVYQQCKKYHIEGVSRHVLEITAAINEEFERPSRAAMEDFITKFRLSRRLEIAQLNITAIFQRGELLAIMKTFVNSIPSLFANLFRLTLLSDVLSTRAEIDELVEYLEAMLHLLKSLILRQFFDSSTVEFPKFSCRLQYPLQLPATVTAGSSSAYFYYSSENRLPLNYSKVMMGNIEIIAHPSYLHCPVWWDPTEQIATSLFEAISLLPFREDAVQYFISNNSKFLLNEFFDMQFAFDSSKIGDGSDEIARAPGSSQHKGKLNEEQNELVKKIRDKTVLLKVLSCQILDLCSDCFLKLTLKEMWLRFIHLYKDFIDENINLKGTKSGKMSETSTSMSISLPGTVTTAKEIELFKSTSGSKIYPQSDSKSSDVSVDARTRFRRFVAKYFQENTEGKLCLENFYNWQLVTDLENGEASVEFPKKLALLMNLMYYNHGPLREAVLGLVHRITSRRSIVASSFLAMVRQAHDKADETLQTMTFITAQLDRILATCTEKVW